MNKIEDNNSLENASNSESSNMNGKREKRTRNRPSKSEIFVEEREELIKELEKKIGLTEEKRMVLLYDLEHNNELKEYLKVKIPKIRKIYKCGCWNYFIQKEENRDEIGLLKSIFKNENYNITNKRILCIKGEVKKLYMELYFNKI